MNSWKIISDDRVVSKGEGEDQALTLREAYHYFILYAETSKLTELWFNNVLRIRHENENFDIRKQLYKGE